MTSTWWRQTGEAEFWERVENEMVRLSLGDEEATRSMVRSRAGEFVLTGLRRTRPETCTNDPLALARAATSL